MYDKLVARAKLIEEQEAALLALRNESVNLNYANVRPSVDTINKLQPAVRAAFNVVSTLLDKRCATATRSIAKAGKGTLERKVGRYYAGDGVMVEVALVEAFPELLELSTRVGRLNAGLDILASMGLVIRARVDQCATAWKSAAYTVSGLGDELNKPEKVAGETKVSADAPKSAFDY